MNFIAEKKFINCKLVKGIHIKEGRKELLSYCRFGYNFLVKNHDEREKILIYFLSNFKMKGGKNLRQKLN